MKKDEIKWVVPKYNGIVFHNYLINSNGVLVSKCKHNGSKKKPLFDDYKEINPRRSGEGYDYLMPVDVLNKERKYVATHRLMWESFISPIDKGMVIDHINEDKLDNRITNLQMITQGENIRKHFAYRKKINNGKTKTKN